MTGSRGRGRPGSVSACGLVRAGRGHRAPFGAHEPRRLDEHGAGPGGTEDGEWGRGRGGGRRTPEVSRPRGAENPRAPNTSAPRAAPPGERPEGLPGKGGRRDTRRRVCVCVSRTSFSDEATPAADGARDGSRESQRASGPRPPPRRALQPFASPRGRGRGEGQAGTRSWGQRGRTFREKAHPARGDVGV